MDIDWVIVAMIASPIIALFVGVALDHYLAKRSRVIAYFGHVVDFRVRDEKGTTLVYTHSLVIRNAGRKTATNVRLGHYAMPRNYNILPAIEHNIREITDTGLEILFPRLVPNEQVTISYIYFEAIEANRIHSYLKSDDGSAKVISVITQQQFPKWLGKLVIVLALIGVIAVLYGIYSLI